MRIYIKFNIIDKDENIIKEIACNKFKIGLGILAFNKYMLNMDKGLYYYKNTVEEGMANLKEVYAFINNSMQEKDFYDAANIELIRDVLDELQEIYTTLNECKDSNLYIYADYKEMLKLYRKNPEKLNPVENIKDEMQYIYSILKGCYNGRHTRKEEIELMEKFKEDLMNELKSVKTLEFSSEGYIYEPKLINIGSNKLVKFLVDVKIQEEPLIYAPRIEEQLYCVNNILEKYQIGYELEKNTSSFANKLKKGIVQVWFMKIF